MENKGDNDTTQRKGSQTETGPWNAALDTLREWDPKWAESCFTMSTNPWTSRVLPRKLVELISVGLNAACTNLNPEGTRRHIRAALEAGATRDEILLILKYATVMAIHSCSLGIPILLDEASFKTLDDAAVQRTERLKRAGGATPAVDEMKALGRWNEEWNAFYELAPVWTDQYMATLIGIYESDLFSSKDIELLSIAFDASYTHMYAPGTRRHIKAALRAGATMEEIIEVLKLCVVQGVQACNLGVPILAEELASQIQSEKGA